MTDLSLRGVPLAVAHRFTAADAANPAHALAQAAFERRVGGRTPLLPAAVDGDPAGPSRRIREYLGRAHAALAAGDPWTPLSDTDVATAAEIHFALVRSAAARAAAPLPAEVALPASAGPGEPPRLALTVRSDLEVDDLILSSLARVLAEAPDAPQADTEPIADPLLRLSVESAALRAASPISDAGGEDTAARADLLAVAARADPVDIALPEAPATPREPEPDLAALRHTLANVDALRAEAPAGGGLVAAVLKRFAEGVRPRAEGGGADIFLLAPGRVQEILSTLNVLRSYEQYEM